MLRFSLSPTGDMDSNTLRIGLINYIVSRQQKEQFIVRIEDIDKAQTIEGKDQEYLDLLKKFAIEQDQLFYQSDSLGRYQQFALSLMEQGKAFACICTHKREDLESRDTKVHQTYCRSKQCLHMQASIATDIKAKKLPYSIHIKKPQKTITFIDSIQGKIETSSDEIGDFMILQPDGSPTYDFASACDDILTNISTLVREESFLNNTPRQIHIKDSLGYHAEVNYAHIPDIETGDIDTISIKWMLSEGFLLDAIINYLLRSGNETSTEFFILPDAIDWFDLQKISKHPIPFDINLLRLINRKHLENMEDIALSKIFGFADADIGRLLKLYLEEADTINILERKIKAIFAPKSCEGEWAREMEVIATAIANAPMIPDFNAFKQYLMEETKFEGKQLCLALQLLITGVPRSPKLSTLYPLIKPYITEIARCTSC